MKKRIYTVATAHLDTSWNWDLETTLREYLPRTIYDNVKLFETYPDYVFNFEGAYRYELMEEYDPEGFALVRKYVEQGSWRVAGSSYENGDVNIPSPEALIRNVLYGNGYFDKTFGKRSRDIYLPDCFGFGWALPSIAAHCNLLGFTTQKVCWSCAYGIPFDLGVWRGPNGERIYASLDARNYAASLKRVRRHSVHLKLNENVRKYDLPFTFVLHGVGDRGGAPKEPSVQVVMRELAQNETKRVEVLCAGSDDVFRDMQQLPQQVQEKLPVWENELVMTDHAVGGYTSRALSKRWNRRAEQLAAATEQASVAAHLLGARSYPRQVLDTCWKRVIAHQFHDDIPGTSLVCCYQRNWNDYMLSLNQLAEEYRFSAACVGRGMDSSFVQGQALLVNNPLQFDRAETVSASLRLSEGCKAVRVYDAAGALVPAQLNRVEDGIAQIAFCSRVPAFGWAVYDVQESETPCEMDTSLFISKDRMENEKYIVSIDENGDIAGIYDRELCCELLDAPIRMALHAYDGYPNYPAWELDYNEVMAPPRSYAAKPQITVHENGPARVSLRIMRSEGASYFMQTLSLDAFGSVLRVENEIEWRSLRTLLKTEFPLAAHNEQASYDLGLGVIQRGNSHERLYEVPAQMWADITEPSGFFGVSVFSDSKVGWDKPDDNTLRLTGIHSPRASYHDGQHLMDFGRNRYAFGIYGHNGGWKNGTQQQANCFHQPLSAFVIPKQAGELGTSYSLAQCSDDTVLVRALKLAQDTQELIVRFNEGVGEAKQGVRFALNSPITAVREVYGSEEEKEGTQFTLQDGALLFDLSPYDLRSFALTVEPTHFLGGFDYAPVTLPNNLDIFSANDKREDGEMPNGFAVPTELVPQRIESGGVCFETGEKEENRPNATLCMGQTVSLPEGAQTLHLLACACGGDTQATLTLGETAHTFGVQDCEEPIGAWDLYSIGATGRVKTDVLAWNSTHAHKGKEDVLAKQLYFFKYSFPLDGGTVCRLPYDEHLVLLAATVTRGEPQAMCATAQFDLLEERPCSYQIQPEEEAIARQRGWPEKKGKYKFLKNYITRRLDAELRRFRSK